MAPDTSSVIGPALEFLDLGGIAVFALSGALAAAAKRQTLVTFLFFALITGVGGGTVRDLLLDAPVFWTRSNTILIICCTAAVAVWLTPTRLWSGSALLWFDAVGLAAYATFGAAKGLAYGVAPLPAIVMGVFTACVGGIIRDVLTGEPSILMRPELYVTAAALSAVLMVALMLLGMPATAAGVIAASAGFALRGLAIWRGLSLPAYGR